MAAATMTRWWAPAGPGIGPDSDDLFLLEAQGDSQRDLGQALLALHRVGAAACEAVASEPLSDEWLLRGVLAKAREMVAPPALETVGKAVGDPKYAGLLLRDLLDDAEAAAVSLYRTFVAKGVVSAVAASRVGKVYGVPIHQLGRYTSVAADPKALAVAVDDVADRTLMDYVAKVVAEEGVDTAVTFSKAPASEDYLERHNEAQDDRGRFVRLRTSQEQLPGGKTLQEMLTAHPELEAEIVADQETKHRTATTRQARSRLATVRTASTRQARAPGQAPAERTAARTATRVSRRQADRQMAARQAVHAAGHAALEEATFSLGAQDVPDPLGDYPSDLGATGPLGYGVAYVLPAAKWNAFKSLTGQAGGNRAVFRAGALDKYAGGAERYGDYDEDLNHMGKAHEAKVRHLGEMMAEADHQEGIADYQVKTFNHRQTYGAITGEELEAAIEKEKKLFLDELGIVNISAELQHVLSADDADDPMLTVLVYMPPSPGRMRTDRPDRRIWEVAVEAKNAVGVDHAAGTRAGKETPELDPNLPLAVTDISKPTDNTIDRYYQRVGPGGGKGFFRNVVHVRSADEDDIESGIRRRGVGKADQHAERSRDFQRMLLAGLIRRDPQTGEFTDTTGPAVQPATRTSSTRQARTRTTSTRQGALRQARAADAPPARQTLRTADRKANRTSQRLALRQQTEIALEQDPSTKLGRTTFLDPGFHYAVLDSGYHYSDMDMLVNENGLHYLEQIYDRPVNIGANLHRTLDSNDRELDAQDAVAALVDEQQKAWTAQPMTGGLWTPLHSAGEPYLVSKDPAEAMDDLHAIALEVEDRVAKSEDIGVVRAVWREHEDGMSVQLYVNRSPMAAQHLVRYEDPLSQGPLELHSEGESRLFSADGIARWLRLRHRTVTGGMRLGGNNDYDEMVLPRVHTFVAVERDQQR